jgi:hypothetical protein
VIAVMEPSRRVYPARNFPTTEAAFHTIGFSQLYISPGDPTQDGGIVVRFYHKPLVTLIWIGTLIMAAGGVLSLMDRRLRVGAPHERQKGQATRHPARHGARRMIRLALAALMSLAACAALHMAVQPDEVLDDPVLEARARDLSAEIRCLVCQNESIDASNAHLARDLRILVRERLVAGDSDREVLDFSLLAMAISFCCARR